jgi:hypothetical protein
MDEIRIVSRERPVGIAGTPLGAMIAMIGTLTMVFGSVWVGIVVELI